MKSCLDSLTTEQTTLIIIALKKKYAINEGHAISQIICLKLLELINFEKKRAFL